MTLNPWRRPEPPDRAELAGLLPAPGDPALPPDRRLLLEEHLMREIRHDDTPATSTPSTATRPTRRRRGVYLAASGGLMALAGGAVAATTLMGSSPASEDSVRCYSAASLSALFNSTSTAEPVSGAPAADNGVTVAGAIERCAGLWAAGLVEPGKVGHPTVPPGGQLVIPSAVPGEGKVPPLTACVLESGEAAVFPGGKNKLCQSLGLARLVDGP